MILDPALIQYGLIAFIVLMLGWIIRLEMKLRKLLGGKEAKTLEGAILQNHANLEKLNIFSKDATAHFLDIEKRLQRSVQAVETARFNPFKGTGEGGSQSFSTAFVSENGKGVVISSLYSRDRVSVFSKPLEKFESKLELTEEEQNVVLNSKNSLK